VFRKHCWAAAFISVLGENAGSGLAYLKALVPPLSSFPGLLYGYTAARQIEQILRSASGAPASDDIEYAIRFIALVIEKKQFNDIDMILRTIEESLDERNGVLAVTIESASQLDNSAEEELRRRIKERIGVNDVKMKIDLLPELLGGYRLRIGGLCIDASLKGQIEKMKADLGADIA